MPIGKRKQEEAKDNFRKGKQAFDEGDINLAFKELHKALDYYQQTDEDAILAEIHRLLGSLYFDKGQLIDSRNYYKRAFKYFKNFGQKIAMADCYDKIAISFMVQSELLHAEDYQIKAINIRKKTPDKKGLARGLKNLAVIQYQLTNNGDKALALLEEALDLAKRANDPKLVVTIALDQANILDKLERYDDALRFFVLARHFSKKYSIILPKESEEKFGENLLLVGLQLYEQQRLEEALKYVKNALLIFRSIKHPLLQSAEETLAKIQASKN